MKTKIKIITATISALVVFASCRNKSIQKEKINDFEIELLFEKDGCKVYRFLDGNKSVYWSNCTGNMQTETHYNNGKVHRTYRVETLTN